VQWDEYDADDRIDDGGFFGVSRDDSPLGSLSGSDAEPEPEANVPGHRAPRSSMAADGALAIGGGALDLTIRGSAVFTRPTADGEYDIHGNPIAGPVPSGVRGAALTLDDDDARCAPRAECDTP
jgi:hypothetical protein